jgi:hypothetical protein
VNNFQSDLAGLEDFLDRYCLRGKSGHGQRTWTYERKTVLVEDGKRGKAVCVRERGSMWVSPQSSLRELARSLGMLRQGNWQWGEFDLYAGLEWAGDYKLSSPHEIVGVASICRYQPSFRECWFAPWYDRTRYHPELPSIVSALIRGEMPVHAFFDFIEENGVSVEDRELFEEARLALPAQVFSREEMNVQADIAWFERTAQAVDG